MGVTWRWRSGSGLNPLEHHCRWSEMHVVHTPLGKGSVGLRYLEYFFAMSYFVDFGVLLAKTQTAPGGAAVGAGAGLPVECERVCTNRSQRRARGGGAVGEGSTRRSITAVGVR